VSIHGSPVSSRGCPHWVLTGRPPAAPAPPARLRHR
jgi:hypothetical protein